MIPIRLGLCLPISYHIAACFWNRILEILTSVSGTLLWRCRWFPFRRCLTLVLISKHFEMPLVKIPGVIFSVRLWEWVSLLTKQHLAVRKKLVKWGMTTITKSETSWMSLGVYCKEEKRRQGIRTSSAVWTQAAKNVFS